MTAGLINPADSAERRTEKLLTITSALMRRVEAVTNDSGAAYAQFQRAVLLEDQVRDRTQDLERALDLLNDANARLGAAMAEAEAARANLTHAIETVQEGFALFGPDDWLILCNSRFAAHTPDVRPALQPGLRFADYVAAVSRSPHLALPDDEGPDTWAARRLRRHRDPHVIFNVRLSDDRWLQVSEHRTADGGTVILQTDVTDIIRAERLARGRLLDDQARMIRATLDHINQGVAIFDAEARLLGWNARLSTLLSLPAGWLRLGASFDRVLGRFLSGLTFGDGMTDRLLSGWISGRAGRAPLSFEVRQGSDLILSAFAEVMPDGGFVLSFTDVTAERAAIEALSRVNETLEQRVFARTLELEDALANAERANASRSRFVAAASHDLLQPLSAAKLFISSVPDAGLAAPAREALDKAQNALQSVEGILGALLDISKLESGRAALDVGPVDLGRLMAQLRMEFAAMADAKGLDLRVRPCALTVESDPTYLRRILQNLIGNAIRYTERGRVLVGARVAAGAVRIEVCDTGPGIPEPEQGNIFREFHRLNARASASEGMGLGLAIVDRACGLLGHPLALVSQVGHGTRFTLRVPRSGAGRPALALPDAPPPAARPQLEGRIAFLVENDADLRAALALVLEGWGMSVLEAASGEDALALIDEIGILPDIFLVDQQLGAGMTGLDFIAACRGRHGPVPVRLITANRSDSLRLAALTGGIDILQKPIDPRALEQVVAAL
jgi:signal transduction histidine kinase/CheY-like chemotaxis protein